MVSLACVARAQGTAIETRLVRQLVDRDGKGFIRAPATITPISKGRYALAEMNELPLVVESSRVLV
jgi:hypothetical protein